MPFNLQHLRYLSRRCLTTFCSARPDIIPLRRAELIQALCKTHASLHVHNDPVYSDGADSWASKFTASANLLESFMLLSHHKDAKNLMYTFRAIDPDRGERFSTDSRIVDDSPVNDQQNLEELSFLTQFACILKRAGFEEVPQETVKRCLKSQHKYGKIELEVKYEDFVFVRFWISGRKEIDEKLSESQSIWKSMFHDDSTKRILHERVIAASRSKHSNNMILKGFKDIPLDHFETLLPEAKVRIPRTRKWVINLSLTTTGLIAFFNVGLTILTDFKLDVVWMFLILSGFIAFRTLAMYRSQRNKYILAWKKMLYFKSTSNNAGLVLDSINRAHEHSFKEALVVYGTALILAESGGTVTEAEVTKAAFDWLSAVNDTGVDENDLVFSCSFSLLEGLGLLSLQSHDHTLECSRFHVLPPDDAAQLLMTRVCDVASG